MSSAKNKWFVTERSRAMANVYLTRRDDLKVDKAPFSEEHGLTLLVRIEKPSSRSIRQFGIAIAASVNPTTPARLNKSLRTRMRTYLQAEEYPYPVLLFYATMQDTQGYFTWLVEPVVSQEGQPRLLRREEADCRLLDRAALDAIVAQVDRWYDAFFATMTATAT
jgi:hypothetical protein